ncbi:MAG TPA: Hsp20/alpha crystallin family protein [Burkholderiaceae bacterium]|nr:Hsp20/alpha crystallin family protein [Burkholderiaceae bacterium]
MANDLTRFDPFRDLARFDAFRGFDDFFRNFPGLALSAESQDEGRIRLDVSENDNAYTVRAEMPGIKKDDVKVNIDGNRVSIRAESRSGSEQKEGDTVLRRECYYGAQSRSFALANDIDEGAATAKYEDGILFLHLPKKNKGTGPTTLTVE